MKTKLFFLFTVVCFLTTPVAVNSQDTIIRKNGEIILCEIQGEDSSTVSFNLKIKGREISTYLNKNEIQLVKYGVLLEKSPVLVDKMEKANISVGIGIPEVTNIGIRFQHQQMQAGFSFGILPINGVGISVSCDVFVHIVGHSKLSDRHPWYFKIGLSYLRGENDIMIDNYLFLNLRIGRDINLSKKIGINVDAGLGIPLFEEESEKTPSSDFDLNIEFPVIPSFSISLFYRL